MKKLIYHILAAMLLFQSCGKDNYEEPTSIIEGKITFNGAPLNVKGTDQAVQLKLYQPGYALKAEVPVFVKQDGSFSIKIFDGKYKLVGRNNNGPWLNATDTVEINLQGKATVNYEVDPYYIIENAQLALSTDYKLSGSFNLVKNLPAANLSYYTILISKTAFVDDVSNIYRKDYTAAPGNPIAVAEDLTSNTNVKSAHALFARIGVRATAADQAIYSEVIKLR
ncbi:DUF3823 domain-containing protein [Sphingobacterium sp. HJSM2_6]|uniref:DUF3823 domain-containing protein n=1 Tax=Sphingobacterium sp. HJSM2_6 TaxID=3366264 RepID=UPI003BC464C4